MPMTVLRIAACDAFPHQSAAAGANANGRRRLSPRGRPHLSGQKPGDLPVSRARLESVINLKTAKTSASPSPKRCWPRPTR
jgi:hypothetical protein